MVVNHNQLKRCKDRDIPLWLSYYQEKFKTSGKTLSQTTGEGEVVVLLKMRGLLQARLPGPRVLARSKGGGVVPSRKRLSADGKVGLVRLRLVL